MYLKNVIHKTLNTMNKSSNKSNDIIRILQNKKILNRERTC